MTSLQVYRKYMSAMLSLSMKTNMKKYSLTSKLFLFPIIEINGCMNMEVFSE